MTDKAADLFDASRMSLGTARVLAEIRRLQAENERLREENAWMRPCPIVERGFVEPTVP